MLFWRNQKKFQVKPGGGGSFFHDIFRFLNVLLIYYNTIKKIMAWLSKWCMSVWSKTAFAQQTNYGSSEKATSTWISSRHLRSPVPEIHKAIRMTSRQSTNYAQALHCSSCNLWRSAGSVTWCAHARGELSPSNKWGPQTHTHTHMKQARHGCEGCLHLKHP